MQTQANFTVPTSMVPPKVPASSLVSANVEVIWSPIKNACFAHKLRDCPICGPQPPSSQELALSCPADQILYHGTRGPGKTDTQLMRFARNVGKGYGAFWNGIIFDREYKSLSDLIKKSRRWFSKIWSEDEAKFYASSSQLKWVWSTGEELIFRTIDDPEDYWKYHGQEFAFMGWNELTQWETSECYDVMQSCNRTSWTQEKNSPKDAAGNYTLPPIPLENFSTTNSHGVGHQWVKERFILPAENGHIVTHKTDVIDPATKEEVEIELTQCAIKGAWWENIYLSPKYIAKLKSERDPNRRKSWYSGDWNIVSGGAVGDLWDAAVHVVSRFRIPKHWRIVDRAYDNGGAHPFSVGWFVETNGEEVEIPRPTAPGQAYGANGFDKWCPQAGSLIQFMEWYGKAEDSKYSENKGSRLGSRKIAQGINKIEFELMASEWCHRLAGAGPADNRIFAKDPDKETPAEIMLEEGVEWEHCDQTPGSRERRLSAFRDRLQASLDNEGPGIYFMRNCEASIATLPILPRDPKKPDDVNTKSVDHAYDMVTYRVQKGNLNYVDDLKMNWIM